MERRKGITVIIYVHRVEVHNLFKSLIIAAIDALCFP